MCHGEAVMGHARVHSKIFALVPQAGTPSLHGTGKLRTEGWTLATKAKIGREELPRGNTPP